MLDAPQMQTKALGAVPNVDAVAVEAEDGSLTIFAVNKDLENDVLLQADLRAFPELKLRSHIQLHADDVKACNTLEAPDCVVPRNGEGGTIENGRLGAAAAKPQLERHPPGLMIRQRQNQGRTATRRSSPWPLPGA